MDITAKTPYTYEDYYNTLEKIREEFPFISVRSIGKSLMGRDIYAIKAGNGDRKVFVNGAHHANEWITTPLLLKFLYRFLLARREGKSIGSISAKTLFEEKSLHMVPLVNPDGMEIVAGCLKKDSPLFKKAHAIGLNYPDIPFPSGWKANAEGVDLNLNYPAMWGKARKIKESNGISAPAPRDFVGTSPLCAPEARAVYDYTLANGFCLTLSYHTQGKVIYWKYHDFLPQNSEEIAKALSSASGYKTEVTPSESGYAGYKDWFISCYDKPGYTIEAGEGENPLLVSQFDSMYKDNEPLIALAMHMA